MPPHFEPDERPVVAQPVRASARSRAVRVAPAPSTSSSRRPERRVPHRVPCRVRIRDAESGATLTLVGRTVNLSHSGFAVQLAREAPLGAWIEALIPHLHNEPVLLCGTVVHCRRVLLGAYELGVEVRAGAPIPF